MQIFVLEDDSAIARMRSKARVMPLLCAVPSKTRWKPWKNGTLRCLRSFAIAQDDKHKLKFPVRCFLSPPHALFAQQSPYKHKRTARTVLLYIFLFKLFRQAEFLRRAANEQLPRRKCEQKAQQSAHSNIRQEMLAHYEACKAQNPGISP